MTPTLALPNRMQLTPAIVSAFHVEDDYDKLDALVRMTRKSVRALCKNLSASALVHTKRSAQSLKEEMIVDFGSIQMKVVIDAVKPSVTCNSRIKNIGNGKQFQKLLNALSNDILPQHNGYITQFLIDGFQSHSENCHLQIENEDGEYSILYFNPRHRTHVDIQFYPLA